MKTITTDNGMEFSAHEIIYKALGVEVFFTDPYSSWQKGAIENANGLMRQYIPKRASFDEFDDKDIQHIKDKINRRPRKNSISFPIVLCQKLPLNLHLLVEFTLSEGVINCKFTGCEVKSSQDNNNQNMDSI